MSIRKQLVLFVLLSACTFAQSYFPGIGSGLFDVPTDPRSVAMGESFTAMNDPLAGLQYNPASLSYAKGISVTHSRRGYFNTPSWQYYTTGMALQSPYGNFGLLYYKFYYPFGNDDYYAYVLGMTYAHPVGEHLSLGISVKTFETHWQHLLNDYYIGYSETSTQPIMLDLGLLYATPLFKESSSMEGELRLGLSLQNFGTNHYYMFKYEAGPGYFTEETSEEPMKYIRTGFSVGMTFKQDNEESLKPLSLLFNADYRNLLNTQQWDRSNRDQWGIGVETTLYEFFSMKGGAFFSRFDGVWGDKGVAQFRYGFGLALPFERFGMNVPFIVNVDYGAVPLNDWVDYSPVETLSFSLHYTNELF